MMRKNALGVADVQFRKENEVKTEYSSRISQHKWDSHEDEIRRLHGEKRTKAEILDALETEYFHPSMPQLNKQMRRWGLKVYGQRTDVPADLQQSGGSASTPNTDTSIPENDILSTGDIHMHIETEVIERMEYTSPLNAQGAFLLHEADLCRQCGIFSNEETGEPHAVDNMSMLDGSSETSSMRTFHAFATRLKTKRTSLSSLSLLPAADTISICSGDSWSFRRVTGMPVNTSTERLQTPDSNSDQRRATFFAAGSEEDLKRLQKSPVLPLRSPLQVGMATTSLSRSVRNERKRVNADQSLPPIACWWPLSAPKYEDEIRFTAAYNLLSVFKSSLSILAAFETNKLGALGPTQAFHDFHDSLLLGIELLNEALFNLLRASDDWSEDSK